MAEAHHFAVKRIYLPAAAADGQRVLVERLWPRGLGKDKAAVDLWLKDVAPSHELRRWFHEAPQARWPEFQERYRAELQNAQGELAELHRLARAGPVTLLFAARDETHNSAVVLKAVLEA